MKIVKKINSIVGDALTIFLLSTCGIYLLVCIGIDAYIYKNMKKERYDNTLANYQYNINIVDSGLNIFFNSIKNRIDVSVERNIDLLNNNQKFYDSLINTIKKYFNNDYIFKNIMIVQNNKLLYSILPGNKINSKDYQTISENLLVDKLKSDEMVYKYQINDYSIFFILDDDLLFNAFFKWHFTNISNNNFAFIMHNKIIYNNNVYKRNFDDIINNIKKEKYVFWIKDFIKDDVLFILHTFSLDNINAYYGFIIPKNELYSGIMESIAIIFFIEFIGLLILMLGVYYTIFYWLKKPVKNIYDVIGTIDFDSLNNTINQIKNISVSVNNYMSIIDDFIKKIKKTEELFENIYNNITEKIEKIEDKLLFKRRD